MGIGIMAAMQEEIDALLQELPPGAEVVEARGVEPLSSKRSAQTSTCLSGGKV
jgi:hypothetical protein